MEDKLIILGKKAAKYIRLKQCGRARYFIKSALKINPKQHHFLTLLALTYYEQHNYKKSLKIEKQALKLAPKCPLVLWDYAGSLDMLRREKEALKIYKGLIAKDIKSIAYCKCANPGIRWARSLVNDCLYRIASCYKDIGNKSKAVAFYKKHFESRKPGIPSIYPLKKVKKEFVEYLSQKK